MEEKDRGRREGKKWMSRRKNQSLLIWNLWVNRSSPSSSSTVQPLFMQLNQSGVEPDPPTPPPPSLLPPYFQQLDLLILCVCVSDCVFWRWSWIFGPTSQHYHFNGLLSEVSVRHQRVLVFGDNAALGQQLQQGAVVFGLRFLGPVPS